MLGNRSLLTKPIEWLQKIFQRCTVTQVLGSISSNLTQLSIYKNMAIKACKGFLHTSALFRISNCRKQKIWSSNISIISSYLRLFQTTSTESVHSMEGFFFSKSVTYFAWFSPSFTVAWVTALQNISQNY